MTRIRILSDLHSEGYKFKYNRLDEDVLVLAGDIGVGVKTVDFILNTFPHDLPIIFIGGNHEFYHNNFLNTKIKFKDAFSNTNVSYLDNASVVIGGIRFLGGTMFSNFGLFGEGERYFVEQASARGINDFHCITTGFDGRKWTIKDCKEEFEKFDKYMKFALHEPFDGKTVVVTHFCPSIKSVHEKFAMSNITPFFSSDCEHLMGFSDLWIHGHTHSSFSYYIGDTQVICNPKGYANENAEVNKDLGEKCFNPNLIVEI